MINYMIQHNLDCEWGGSLGQETLPRKKHAPASYWHDENSEKFAVIRHPATRLVSFFRYTNTLFGAFENVSFSEFINNRLRPAVKKKLVDPWLDQCHWLMYQDRMIVTHRLRMEMLEQDVHAYLGDFGPVPRLNTTSEEHEDLMAWYSEKDLRRVKKAFARDFDMLGYQ